MKGILEFSGRRGRRFKSCRFDTKSDTEWYPFFVVEITRDESVS